ncbi:MAG: DUF89 family protein [Bacteroidales bacterium]|nr:DUF89 family protein [Bacteroidales bacterium]
MSIDYRCIDCFKRNYSKLTARFPLTESQSENFMKYFDEVMKNVSTKSSPKIQRDLHRKFRDCINIKDPYYKEKKLSNKIALDLYKIWKPKVLKSKDPFDTALRLAVAANIIDYGALDKFDLDSTIDRVFQTNFTIDYSSELKEKIKKAKTVLYLGDNAGEIVFDKLFIETIDHRNVIYVVKGGPIINDITIEDAKEVNMNTVAKVISNAYDAPSTVLKKSGKLFTKFYNKADLIISKGQGNFEGLFSEKDPRIFFLFMAKCDLIAELVQAEKDSFIVYNQPQN